MPDIDETKKLDFEGLFDLIFKQSVDDAQNSLLDGKTLEGIYNKVLRAKHEEKIDFDDETKKSYIGFIVKYISSQSGKWDILMAIKANYIMTNYNHMLPISCFEKLFGFKPSNTTRNLFINSKNRIGKNYDQNSLFFYFFPFFHFPLYNKKSPKANPYGLESTSKKIKLSDYISLKKTYLNIINPIFEKIPDNQTQLCMKIVNEYFLEATYGFRFKTEIANYIAKKNDIVVDFFTPSYEKEIKEQVILNVAKTDAIFEFTLPEKYKELNPSMFVSLFSFLTNDEKDVAYKVFCAHNQKLPSFFGGKSDNVKHLPDSGYILMYVLFGKSVCEKFSQVLMQAISDRVWNTKLKEMLLYWSTLKVNRLLCVFDMILEQLDLSLPGTGHFSDDDKLIVKQIKECLHSAKNPNPFESFVPKYLNELKSDKFSHVVDFCQGIECILYEFSPKDNYALEQFYLHVKKACSEKEKNIVPGRIENDDVRAFRDFVKMLIDNCFHYPSIEMRSVYPSLLPCEDIVYDKDYISRKIINSNKESMRQFLTDVQPLPVTRNKMYFEMLDLRNEDDIYYISRLAPLVTEWIVKMTIHSMKEKVGTEFDSLVMCVYNEKLIEHIDNNLTNINLDKNVKSVSPEIQDRIVRMRQKTYD